MKFAAVTEGPDGREKECVKFSPGGCRDLRQRPRELVERCRSQSMSIWQREAENQEGINGNTQDRQASRVRVWCTFYTHMYFLPVD